MQRYAREIAGRLNQRPRLIAPPAAFSDLRSHLWEQLALPGLLRPGELLWSPANTGPLRVARQVLTLHDLDMFDCPDRFSRLPGAWLRYLLPRLLRNVRGVIVPSETQRRQVLDRFHLPPEIVFAVPGGVDLRRFHPVQTEAIMAMRRSFGLPSDYFLLFGNLESGWNFRRLLQDWREMHREYPRLCLAVTGLTPPSSAASQQFSHPGIRFLTPVEERDLAALYSGALAAVFPSPGTRSEEGAALLEALACGVPVITAGGVPAEIAGDAGLLVETGSTAAVMDAMKRLATDARLQADLCCRGLERARQFSWEAAAQQVGEILLALS